MKSEAIELLKQQLKGDLYTDDLRRYLLSTDGSIYMKEPLCVIYPKSVDDVELVVSHAREYGLSIHPRGSGSGLCGSAIGGGLVIDFSKYMNRLLKIDRENRWFECEPGYRFGELEQELEGSDLFFPPDPSSGEYASFGGMYGTNASGAHSVKYGNVSDYILDSEVQFADGSRQLLSEIEQTPLEQLPANLSELAEIYRQNADRIESAYPEIKCNVAGYNLRGLIRNGCLHLHQLYAGAEGTLGVVTRLRLALKEKPACDSLVVAFFDDIINSARAAQLAMTLNPSGIEIMDKSLLNLAKDNDPQLRDKIPEGIDNLLLIEFDAFKREEARAAAETAKEMLTSEGLTDQAYLAASAEEKAKFWSVRKAAVPILYKLKGEKKILALVEDAAVPIEGLVDYFKGIYEILNRHQLHFVVYGHIAKGLMHTRPLLNLKDVDDIALLKVLADEVYDLVTSLNGTVSGEHGDGRIRSFYVKRSYPDIYELLKTAKQQLDPSGIFNPEIIINNDSDLISSNLRYGTAYHGKDLPRKYLCWDEGFVQQVETCHGCSKCTTVTTATRMCPIYKFTRDEAAAPKAKANALRALISGDIDDQYLYKKQFHEIINLCVNCGSCYQECPSNVNIPKLALEAKAHYVGKFGVSIHNRAVTGIETVARLTHRFSPLVGPILNLPFSKKVMETFLGISANRKPVTFSRSPLRKRVSRKIGNRTIKTLYFAGCYASHIRPEIGEAAIQVLNRAGIFVMTPEQHCCGLPMLSKGMVKEAKTKIRKNLKCWAELLKTVDYLVVTCSSCGLSLRAEWKYLIGEALPDQLDKKIVHISSLIMRFKDRLGFVDDPLEVGYHMPCHLKVQEDSQSSLRLLGSLPGIDIRDLESHCCGIAGSWGMAADHFELSKKIGSDMVSRLDRSPNGIGATDCPTCRMQMETFSRKTILHPIEILARRLK